MIAGPTASGKSGLAIKLANRFDGVIINTDAMQVYHDLRIVTARPTLEEESDAPHRLYGFVDERLAYSTGAWLRDVTKVLAELRAAFPTLIFVGGTGLYFNALTAGLSEIPETPMALRQSLRVELAAYGPAALHAQLQLEDHLSADGLNPSDGQRIIRSLEVLRNTGRPLRTWQMVNSTPVIDVASPETKAIVLSPDRDDLATNIAKRFDVMVKMGAVDEVSALIARNLDPQLPAMKAIGVAELGAYTAGWMSLDEATRKAVTASRQYAKRQRTWFRGQMGERWEWFEDAKLAVQAFSD